ncbi:hypothetical protein GCM10009551_037520 [Nocardiopsis tropica]
MTSSITRTASAAVSPVVRAMWSTRSVSGTTSIFRAADSAVNFLPGIGQKRVAFERGEVSDDLDVKNA